MSENSRPTPWWRSTPVLLLLTFAVAFTLGKGTVGQVGNGNSVDGHGHPEVEAATIWTCSMHPQIQLPEAGQCPICLMDLIPLESGASDADMDVARLEMSEAARAMAEIETTPVVRDRPFVELHLVGKVDFDETRVASITARAPGRLDRLFVDYMGIPVRAGDHLAEIYSPELLSAQEELLQAMRARASTGSSASSLMKGSAEATVEAAREKLRLLGLTTAQVDRLSTAGSTSDHVTLFAQTSGIVVEKRAIEGDYVSTGAVIYRIADLAHLWVNLDAYEPDLAWLRYGQEVEFMSDAVPGKVFSGEVVFIAPLLDPKTRTVKVRVHVDNAAGLLKPGFFVRATVLAEVGGGGDVISQDLAGKWICPMHPEVVRDGPDDCDVCGMDLERAEDLGHVSPDAAEQGPLVIPRSAVLFTGRRAVVYVESSDSERPTYEGREVVLGPRAGDVYLVVSGLAEGERVVVKGNFKIDSALQIQARPSMMSPDAGGSATIIGSDGASGDAATLHSSADFLADLAPLYDAYFAFAGALSADKLDAAHESRNAIHAALATPRDEDLSIRGRQDWGRVAREFAAVLDAPIAEGDIEALRMSFQDVSKSVIEIAGLFGHAGETPFYLTFCPMAFDFQGAHWVQDHKQIDNPYFGSKMLRCGSVEEEFSPVGGES